MLPLRAHRAGFLQAARIELFHGAGPTEGGKLVLRASWHTKDSFDKFAAETLMPTLRESKAACPAHRRNGLPRRSTSSSKADWALHRAFGIVEIALNLQSP